jgi:hypothetical protein
VVTNASQLRVGQWLETDHRSRARVDVGLIGEVTVEPDSRLRLIDASATDHRLELSRGQLHAQIWAPPRLFFVNTPSATAIDLGCAYTLKVDDRGAGELQVTAGYVALARDGRETIVAQGQACHTWPGAGAGTPYAVDASQELRRALDDFDLATGDRTAAVAQILSVARAEDFVTLWHLLERAPRASRGRVFDQLAQNHPAPADVTRAGIIAGESAMRAAWAADLGLATVAASNGKEKR